jgi:hypothetical protein
MARGKKTGGKDFTKKDPRIRPRKPYTEEQRAIREACKTELGKTIVKYGSMSLTECVNELREKNLPILHKCVISCYLKGLKSSDFGRYVDPLIDRAIGRSKIFVEAKIEEKADPLNVEKIVEACLSKKASKKFE